MYMEPIVRAKTKAASTSFLDVGVGLMVLAASAMLILPSLALFAAYCTMAAMARFVWKGAFSARR